MNEEIQKPLSSLVDDDNVQIIFEKDQILLAGKKNASKYNVNRSANVNLRKYARNSESLKFKVGLFEKEMFLYYDKDVSEDRIFVS